MGTLARSKMRILCLGTTQNIRRKIVDRKPFLTSIISLKLTVKASTAIFTRTIPSTVMSTWPPLLFEVMTLHSTSCFLLLLASISSLSRYFGRFCILDRCIAWDLRWTLHTLGVMNLVPLHFGLSLFGWIAFYFCYWVAPARLRPWIHMRECFAAT